MAETAAEVTERLATRTPKAGEPVEIIEGRQRRVFVPEVQALMPKREQIVIAADGREIFATNGAEAKFTPTRRKKLITEARKGRPIKDIAALADIHPVTLRKWLGEGANDPIGPYAKFYVDFTKAVAEKRGEILDLVEEAAKKGPQFWAAGMTYLERVWPEEFGKAPSTRVEINNNIASFEARVLQADTVSYSGG